MPHRQRLNQRRFIQRDGIGDGVHPAAFDRDFLCQTAAAAAQANKVHVFGQMIIAALARWHIIADDVGLNHHVLPHLNIGNAFAHGIHHA